MAKQAKTEKAEAKSRGAGRTRNFATIVYPTEAEYNTYYEACGGVVIDQYGEGHKVDRYDGAEGWGTHPDNWQDIIIDAHIAALISPMHIGDQNPDGRLKKPHYHVLVMYESVKDYETQVKPFIESFGGVGREQVQSARGYARYLCHLDNPEKCQYNSKDIKAYGGANWDAITHLPTDDMQTLKDIFKFIRANRIYSLADLLDILADSNQEWFMTVAMNRTYTIGEYIKSLTWEQAASYVPLKDREAATTDTARKEDNHEGNGN